MNNLRDSVGEGQDIVAELLGAVFEVMNITKA